MPLLTTFAGASIGAYGFESAVASADALELIATINGTGSSGTITFSSIPTKYRHLQIRATLRDNYNLGWNQPYITFNSDSTSSNYSWHEFVGNGSSNTSTGAANTLIYMEQIASTYGGGTNPHSSAIVDVLNYGNTNTNKTLKIIQGTIDGGLTKIAMVSGSWRNTSAISSISLINGNNFTTTSRFSLYGVKG